VRSRISAALSLLSDDESGLAWRSLRILDGDVPVTADEVRALASSLPRSYEAHVRGQVKFRIGQIVYLALSEDGSRMGCGFPKEFRSAAVEGEPGKFALPRESDLRFNWIHVRLAAIDAHEMRDLVEDAWARAVPKYVAEEYALSKGYACKEVG
jgi:hypothetical protein